MADVGIGGGNFIRADFAVVEVARDRSNIIDRRVGDRVMRSS
jgi:hypothetical protein